MVVVSGYRYLSGGQVDTGDIVLHGGELFVSSGGTIINTTVNSGGQTNSGYFNPGEVIVYSGGTASGTQVYGDEFLYGGMERGATIFSGGSQIDQGTSVSTTISGPGFKFDSTTGNLSSGSVTSNAGEQTNYGSASNTIINGGIQLDIGGTAVSTTINSGGWQYIYNGGVAINTIIHSGEQLLAGNRATSTTVDSSGGIQYVSYGAEADATTLVNGGQQTVIGLASGTTISSGGTQVVPYGNAYLTTVSSGGVQDITGGIAQAATISDGGIQYVSSGNAFTATISSGGEQLVLSGAYAGGELAGGIQGSTTIYSSGVQDISSGGTSFNTVISSGGIELISGGVAVLTTIIDGYEYIDSGGSGRGEVISGGMLEVVAGGSINGFPVRFAGSGGTLRIDATAMPSGCIISGFAPGDTIDLAGVPFDNQDPFAVRGAFTLLKTNNVLELDANEQAYDFQLDPAQVISGGFQLTDDGDGGTAITMVSLAATGYSTSASPPPGTVLFNPYGAVCNIFTNFGSATGFIIGPHAILTNAHVVQQGDTGASQITVYPGDEQGSNGIAIQDDPFGAYTFAQVNSGYNSSHLSGAAYLANEQNDYAVIYVAADLQDYGSFQLASFNSGTVSITGYPTNQQYDYITPASVDPTVSGILDEPFTGAIVPGFSGSPLWIVNGGTVQAVGLFAGDSTVANSYIAVRFTASAVQQIQSWENDDAFFGATISGGQSISGSTLSGADRFLDILSGGSAIGTTIEGGSTENVFGQDAGATVSAGGVQYIYAGGIADNVLLATSGFQIARSGGTASGTLVSSGGSELVSSGGVASGTQVSGGEADIFVGGVMSGSELNSGATVIFGVERADQVSGGIDLVFGSAFGTQITGGLQIVETGGSASGSVVSGAGEEYVSSGGVVSGTTLNAGAELVYGTEFGTIINGGVDHVFGHTSNTVINNGGLQIIESGASVSGTTVNSGGEEYISSGASVRSDTFTSGFEVVAGSAFGNVFHGGIDFDYGTASATVLSGALQIVESGASASGTTVVSNGEEYIASGGTGSSTTVNSGAEVTFGTAFGTIVNSGGVDLDYGVESGTVVNSGGLHIIEAGASISGSAVTVNSGAEEYVASGASIRNVTITSGFEVVFGTETGNTFHGGIDFDYATASGTVLSGALQIVEAGALASGTTVSGSNGEEYVASGGTVSGLVFSNGFEVMFGTETGNTFRGGTDFDYGSAFGTVMSGAIQIVEAGGSASGTQVTSGGQLYVVSGGTAFAAVISNGSEVVYGTTVSNTVDGHDIVFAGGIESAAILANGAVDVVSSGGVTIGDHVNSGSLEFVASGGTASGSIISGGVMEIDSGGSIGTGGTASFATSGGGILRLDDSIHFGGLVAGFGLPDGLDLKDIAYVSSGALATTLSWTQLTSGANASGTLTVSEGGHAANITLLGQYVTGNFNMHSDGFGGTLVADPPVTSNATPGGGFLHLLEEFVSGLANTSSPIPGVGLLAQYVISQVEKGLGDLGGFVCTSQGTNDHSIGAGHLTQSVSLGAFVQSAGVG